MSKITSKCAAPLGAAGELRSADRYLLSPSKFSAALEFPDGEPISGYLADVSKSGCSIVAIGRRLRLRTNEAVVVAGEHRFAARIVRASTFGERLSIGMDVPAMPAAFLAAAAETGGAVRFDGQVIAIHGKLNMPVAAHAMRLLGRPDVSLDLSACSGMELAGAGFLIIAAERGTEIRRMSAAVQRLLSSAGIDLNKQRAHRDSARGQLAEVRGKR